MQKSLDDATGVVRSPRAAPDGARCISFPEAPKMGIEALAVVGNAHKAVDAVKVGIKAFKNRGRAKRAREELARIRERRRQTGDHYVLAADNDSEMLDLYEWMADEGMIRRTSHGSYYELPEDPRL
ncbi:MAG: hypothetical protein SF187_28995 [Deltaproteobacteria bacterium]|nr:hypothetical protein [Deltaproteobacteria bacterium]